MAVQQIEVSVYNRIAEIPAEEWDNCACPESVDGRPVDPFTTHRFLRALEESGSVSLEAGWVPFHLVSRLEGEAIAVMPLYAKYNSFGEYVFDHSWAHAFERAGGTYYPKLLSCVPFTPATGRRILARPGHETEGMNSLVRAALRILEGNNLSSLHVNFCTESEARMGKRVGLMKRTGEQFHWMNRNYRDFDAFLCELTSRKRKNVKRERRIANEFGGNIELLTADQILPEHWDAFWLFYEDTGSRKWGSNYLTRSFYDEIHESMRDDLLLIMCRRGGRYVAGALNFMGRDTLFGRYWGCTESHSCLHFEVCYYLAIEFAIRHGMQRVEAGAQGPHKLARGYMPVPTYSLHWIENTAFRRAVMAFLDDETQQVDMELNYLRKVGPFKKGTGKS